MKLSFLLISLLTFLTQDAAGKLYNPKPTMFRYQAYFLDSGPGCGKTNTVRVLSMELPLLAERDITGQDGSLVVTCMSETCKAIASRLASLEQLELIKNIAFASHSRSILQFEVVMGKDPEVVFRKVAWALFHGLVSSGALKPEYDGPILYTAPQVLCGDEAKKANYGVMTPLEGAAPAKAADLGPEAASAGAYAAAGPQLHEQLWQEKVNAKNSPYRAEMYAIQLLIGVEFSPKDTKGYWGQKTTDKLLEYQRTRCGLANPPPRLVDRDTLVCLNQDYAKRFGSKTPQQIFRQTLGQE